MVCLLDGAPMMTLYYFNLAIRSQANTSPYMVSLIPLALGVRDHGMTTLEVLHQLTHTSGG